MFSFQGTSLNHFFKRFNEVSNHFGTSVNLFKMWWRLAGSNRWPPACKAGALPAELNPQIFIFLFLKWWAKDSLFFGKATAVATVHRTVAKSRLSSPFWRISLQNSIVQVLTFYLRFYLKWWAKMDSNHRPHDYQSCALASWAIGPYRLHFFFRYIILCTL